MNDCDTLGTQWLRGRGGLCNSTSDKLTVLAPSGTMKRAATVLVAPRRL